jgi:hypothetical protein
MQNRIINTTDTTNTTTITDTTNTRTGAKIDLDPDRLDVRSGHLGLGLGLLSAATMDLLGAVLVVLLNVFRTVLHPVEVQDEDPQTMVPGANFPTVSARSGKSARSTSEP